MTVTAFIGLALAALALSLLVVAAFAVAERVVPDRLAPTHRALALPAALMTTLLLLVAGTDGLEPLLVALDPRDALGTPKLARHGPAGALMLFALALATFLLVYLALRVVLRLTRPRDPDRSPVPAWARALGLADDGRSTAAQAPIRLGVALVALAAFIALPALPETAPLPVAWVAGTVAFVGWFIALSPRRAVAPAIAALPATAPSATPEPLAPWLTAAGPLTPLPGEAAIPPSPDADGLWPHQRLLLAKARTTSALAFSAPPGAGKRTAALVLARDLADQSGRPVVWLGDASADELIARLSRLDPLATLLPLVRLAGADAPGPDAVDAVPEVLALGGPSLIVVELAGPTSGAGLARLRYLVDRLSARAAQKVLVLGNAAPETLASAARVITAATPSVIAVGAPDTPLATRPIVRSLAPGRLDHLPPPPPSAARLFLDRPEAMPRYPGEPIEPVHEVVAIPGGPRGRRILDWLSSNTPPPPPRRLLLALPGDREVPEPLLRLARAALVTTLADGFRDLARLEAVFSKRVVVATLGALGPRIERRLGPNGRPELRLATVAGLKLEPPDLVDLVEPRGGVVARLHRESLELMAFEGAIVAGHEVAFTVDGDRVLWPTTATAATPLRRLIFTPAPGARESTALHRFQGRDGLEVKATRLMLAASHHGVRRFEGREARHHTTLSVGAMRLVPPRPVEAVTLALPGASEAALHALRHAISELLPLHVDNAEDVGVTFAMAPELGRPHLVFWDRHPEGLGAVHDLRAADLHALLAAAQDLLGRCECALHCARCCESTGCTTPDIPLDRHAALDLLTPLLTASALRSTA